MKFTYWTSRFFGSTFVALFSLIGIAIFAGLITAGYFAAYTTVIQDNSIGIVQNIVNEANGAIQVAKDQIAKLEAIIADGTTTQEIKNQLQPVVDGLNTFINGGITNALGEINKVINGFNEHLPLIKTIGQGVFIGGIAGGSVALISFIGWLISSPFYKANKKQEIIESHRY